MRPIPSFMRAFLRKEERDVLRVYDDKRPKLILKPGSTVLGKLTAGTGHTGDDLHIGLDVTQAMSDKWLTDDLIHKAALPLARKIGAVVNDLTEHQYGALLSFVFNLGTGDPKKKEWTIWKKLRARQFKQIPAELVRFINWQGEPSPGLVRRRQAEVALWLTNPAGSAVAHVPSSVTRREQTPPSPTDTKPLLQSKSFNVQGLAAINGSLSTGTAVIREQVEPYSYMSAALGKLLVVLIVLTVISSVVGLYLTWMKKRQANR